MASLGTFYARDMAEVKELIRAAREVVKHAEHAYVGGDLEVSIQELNDALPPWGKREEEQ